jgi:hypothetical protein
LTSFPISAGFGQSFVVGFMKNDNEICHSKSIYFIHLFDINLNLMKSIWKIKMIESVFMNESNIITSYLNNTNECCQVYDCKLNELFSFGQKMNEQNPFYLENSIAYKKVNHCYCIEV